MSKQGVLRAAVALVALTTGCEAIIGANFENFDVRQPGDPCIETCSAGWTCNRELGECQCVPQTCEAASQECGGFIDLSCGQAVDCGACPTGLECTNAGNGAPNQCTPINGAPCQPKTCAELGQNSGVHVSCGILIDCGPAPQCKGGCADQQVCTNDGCCTPSPVRDPLQAGAPKVTGQALFEEKGTECGMFPDGCGGLIEVQCKAATCINGHCCSDVCTEQSSCGLNASTVCPGVYLECPGNCADGSECLGDARPFCSATCTSRGTCPSIQEANCGANNADDCGGFIQCFGQCPVPGDICTEALECCTPRCPAKPEVCGANDSGCGTTIQCPGPCPAGGTCMAASDGTFACLP
jgi:hypothetical protein